MTITTTDRPTLDDTALALRAAEADLSAAYLLDDPLLRCVAVADAFRVKATAWAALVLIRVQDPTLRELLSASRGAAERVAQGYAREWSRHAVDYALTDYAAALAATDGVYGERV